MPALPAATLRAFAVVSCPHAIGWQPGSERSGLGPALPYPALAVGGIRLWALGS